MSEFDPIKKFVDQTARPALALASCASEPIDPSLESAFLQDRLIPQMIAWHPEWPGNIPNVRLEKPTPIR